MLNKKNKVIYISSYPPRTCGIATFSQDLVEAIRSNSKDIDVEIIPVIKDIKNKLPSGKQTGLKIFKENRESFLNAARYVNEEDAIAVSVQHEYGLFGGAYGEYIIDFLQAVKKPVVTTLHTVLDKPLPKQRKILQTIALNSSMLIVMAKAAVDILTTVYNIPPEKIMIIPHGVQKTAFLGQRKAKEKLGLSEELVLSTFGLIGPGKGLEYVIEALPEIKIYFPKIKYLILGKTHPDISSVSGETYRQELTSKISRLGLKNQVSFVNHFMSKEEITLNLQASDLYVTPYLNPQQITSGTLAYALSMGRACVSTPYIYARELLADGRGSLVPFRDSAKLSEAIISLLKDDVKRAKIERKNYHFSRPMIWTSVAKKYVSLFKHLYEKSLPLTKVTNLVYPPNLSHLKKMTTNIGIFQHSRRSNPDPRFGYSIDDNARALLVAYQYFETYNDRSVLPLAKTYFDYIKKAKIENSYFHNFSDSEGKYIDEIGSETSSCRVIWALGYTVSRRHVSPKIAKEAKLLLESLPPVTSLKYLRSKAYAILGYYYLGDKKTVSYLADSLVQCYEKNIKVNWFEKHLAYANAIMPLSLFLAHLLTGKNKYLEIGRRSFNFLDSLTRKGVFPSPVSHLGWKISEKERPVFDQQLIEAADMVIAASAGKITTKDSSFDTAAKDWFDWFYGKNLNQIALIKKSGACFDGLTPQGVNVNQGAESVVCHILAYLALANQNLLHFQKRLSDK